MDGCTAFRFISAELDWDEDDG